MTKDEYIKKMIELSDKAKEQGDIRLAFDILADLSRSLATAW